MYLTNVFSIASTPSHGSLGFSLEGSGLQDAFQLARVPSATALYPIENDYMAPKAETQVDLTMQLDTFPAHYQTTGDEVHSVAIGDVPQPFIAPESSSGTVQETDNPTSLSYDDFRVR